jgi:hypothetical protein
MPGIASPGLLFHQFHMEPPEWSPLFDTEVSDADYQPGVVQVLHYLLRRYHVRIDLQFQ